MYTYFKFNLIKSHQRIFFKFYNDFNKTSRECLLPDPPSPTFRNIQEISEQLQNNQNA